MLRDGIKRLGVWIWLVALAFPMLPSQTQAKPEINIETTATRWSGHGLKIELQPLPADLVRAFFLGRGFSKKNTEFLVEEACVFRSDIGNAGTGKSDPPVTIELEKWRVIAGGKSSPPRTRENWEPVWEERKADTSARMAFNWGLIPTRLTYLPTDYNWGILTFMKKPGTKIDVKLAWLEGDKPRSHIIKNLRCGG